MNNDHYKAILELHGNTRFSEKEAHCNRCGDKTAPWKAVLKAADNTYCFPCERSLSSHVIDD